MSIDTVFTIIQGSSSVILAGLTFFYLKEVAKTRKMTEKVLQLEWTTEIDVSLNTASYSTDRNSKRINIPYNLIINNIGKLPVNALNGKLSITLDDAKTIHEINYVERLGSSITHTFTFSFSRTETEIEQLSNLNANTVMRWESPLPQVEAEVKLEYKDGLTDKILKKLFKYKYEFNRWEKI
jgi:hypothetical protein